ncbi:MAG: hypothetical protein H7X95_02675, partial [Deltaproteobacteria bacterium]|nr:hypothetical protein [Deltaproteobacteria bacterium]
SLSGSIAAPGAAGVAGDAPAAGSAFAPTSPFGQPSNSGNAAASAGIAPPPPAGFAPPPPPAPGFVPPTFPLPSRSLPKPTSPLPPAPAAVFGAAAPDDILDEDKHVQQIYLEFLATKQQCGESAVGLTLEKFSQRLQENKASLMAKHVCRTVRFSVYVKDGKASLRATPVK